MRVIGQFRDTAEPDHFVWLRGFPDMPSRQQSLAAFYGGSVWAEQRDAANATMIDSDDVLLLRPIRRDSRFAPRIAAKRDAGDKTGSVVIVTLARRAARERDAVEVIDLYLAPALEARGLKTIALYETEPSENTFPRLPVRAANVLVWIGACAAVPTPESVRSSVAGALESQQRASAHPIPPFDAIDVAVLVPTPRSLLDGGAASAPE